MLDPTAARIGIIGLGYVGLPLAVEFGRGHDTVGYDIDATRVDELRAGRDRTCEIEPGELAEARRLRCSADPSDLRDRNVYVVTVPTPIDAQQRPDLRPLQQASELLAGLLAPGDLVIYESTVYPGTTEEICVPILERGSGLAFNRDFFCGYSPERINPGDRHRRLADIPKITSGSTAEAADAVDALYARIIGAGTHRASSIRVAEAAKVVENIQRDVNIGLINELAMMFDRLGIDTLEVLEAAGTKWNFLPFRPGLVGGHCIGVDPYYLTHKSESVGYHPELILAARAINNRVGAHVALRVAGLLGERGVPVAGARVLVLGLTFKENCPDLRNSRVVDVIDGLKLAGARVDAHDPWAEPDAARRMLGIDPVASPEAGAYDAVVLAVAHRAFREMTVAQIRALGRPGAVVYDVKSAWPREAVAARL
ncbi:nucleotide sugar dehydrogenase [Luteimonas sp. RD2P54]|uniref:Nucleotide sugar dehydrogenase n=1 Tax=Luteimonas endophytica TaxID=3042023 RepID=A0ABT6JCQ2_9GAMM|nr:nucleotide sugar dehydrogenase [Luteimonas endophytica]MDH5824345.1 nucleotide sugar dehydrogenase [Luteimonas endophytica]